jgi:hypothetical protein
MVTACETAGACDERDALLRHYLTSLPSEPEHFYFISQGLQLG